MSITLAFIKKEFLQIIRDPSSLIIAFVLPTLLLFIYAYGINLDFANVRLGIKNDDGSPATEELAGAFGQNRFITAVRYDDRKQMQADLTRAKIQGALTIPSDFTRRLAAGKDASLQLITDGANINQVSHTQNYVNQIVSGWLQKSGFATAASPAVEVQARYRYNQNADGRRALVPSSLAVTMTLIGILLTALVVSREWERGTMEALLAANIRPIHIVIGKYVPYFVVGMLSLTFSMFVIIFVFGLPFGGSYWVLFIVSALFLYASLGIGLIISSLLRDQLLASMASLIIGFLPALMMSGVVFPILSMPPFFRWLTKLLPPTHYVSFIKSEFLAGTVWQNALTSSLFLLLLGFLFSLLVYRKTAKRLDD